MSQIVEKQIAIVARPDRYISFPALVTLDNGELLMAFRSGRNCYRDFPEALNLGWQHPHTDYGSEPWIARSRDDGRTWTIEDPPRSRKLMDEDHAQGIGYQDVGFTKLPDGRVMLSVFRWKYTDDPPPPNWATAVREEDLSSHVAPRSPELTYDYRRYQPFRYAYCPAPIYSICDASGRSWTPFKEIKITEPGSNRQWNLATRNGGVMLDDNTVGWPFYREIDMATRARSGCHLLKYDVRADRWSYGAQLAAGSLDAMMEEPLVHRHPDGKTLIGFYRTTSPGYMYSNVSRDNGKTWSPEVQTRVWGHPFAALNLGDDILLAYGYRREPFGIRMCRLRGGDVNAFDPATEIVVRDDAASDDIGYPAMCIARDGAIVLAYYYNARDDENPVRYIAVQRLDREDMKC